MTSPIGKQVRGNRIYLTGFTMTELLIVLAIIAIFSLVAVPSFVDFLGHNRLKGASMAIAAACKAARQYAITKREKCLVIVKNDEANSIYHAVKIYHESQGTLENWREIASTVQIYSINFETMTMPFPNDSDTVTAGHYYIEFYPDGHASHSKHIGIQEKVDTSNTQVINIYNSTGDVRVK